MKTILRISVCLLCASTIWVLAQDSVPTPNVSLSTAAAATPATSIPSAPDLIPAPPFNPAKSDSSSPEVPAVPDTSSLQQIFQQNNLGAQVDEYRNHLEWRKLRTRAMTDPDVIAAKKWAAQASTDLEKRKRLHAYYDLFYRHMRALASSPQMGAYIDAQRDVHYSLLAQPKVRPTPENAPTPTPAPPIPPAAPLPTIFIPLPVPTLTPLQLPK